jgi:hypothetical protein
VNSLTLAASFSVMGHAMTSTRIPLMGVAPQFRDTLRFVTASLDSSAASLAWLIRNTPEGGWPNTYQAPACQVDKAPLSVRARNAE